jgi:hypothetical protein
VIGIQRGRALGGLGAHQANDPLSAFLDRAKDRQLGRDPLAEQRAAADNPAHGFGQRRQGAAVTDQRVKRCQILGERVILVQFPFHSDGSCAGHVSSTGAIAAR